MFLARYFEERRQRKIVEQAQRRRVAACTIATRAFVPWSTILFESLRRHHPHAQLVLLYVREPGEARRLPRMAGVNVIGTDVLVDAAREAGLRRRYGLAELCFALKPRLLGHCLDRFGERALYFDSDIDVLGPLDDAVLALESASLILTPHLDSPLPMDGKLPSEMTTLRAGACNAGFVGVAEGAEARRFLAWWDERVARWGFLAPENGYQGDQKWLDLAPSLFAGTRLLRDPGCNVGTWNLHSRSLARDANGTVTANGARVAFVHFSGFDPRRPDVLSKYDNRHDAKSQPVMASLARDFGERVVRSGAATIEWEQGDEAAEPPADRVTVRDGPMPEAAYRSRVECTHRGGILAGGEEAAIQVTVSNLSPEAWPVGRDADGRGGIALSWHVRAADGGTLLDSNPRYFLPRDLGAGESIEMDIGVRMPPRPGVYRIEFDLVHEHVTWFAHKGNPTVTQEIEVDTFTRKPVVR